MAWSSIILYILILVSIGLLPFWPYSRGWGYIPSLMIILTLVVMLALKYIGYPYS
jgi:Protein of unknown function (DUF3309)